MQNPIGSSSSLHYFLVVAVVSVVAKKSGTKVFFKFAQNLILCAHRPEVFIFEVLFRVAIFFSRKTAFETSLDVNIIITSELLEKIGARCRDLSSIASGSLGVEESGAEIQGRFYLVKMDLPLVLHIIIIIKRSCRLCISLLPRQVSVHINFNYPYTPQSHGIQQFTALFYLTQVW